MLHLSFAVLVALTTCPKSLGDESNIDRSQWFENSNHNYSEIFKHWKKTYNKHYDTTEQERHRLGIFIHNWKKIVEFNTNENNAFQVNVNQFAGISKSYM